MVAGSKFFQKTKNIKKFIIALTAIFLLLLTYQNCSEIKLQTRAVSVNSTSIMSDPVQVNLLRAPEANEHILRAAFFVDMSRSTGQAPCAETIDGNLTPFAIRPCDTGGYGSDPHLRRFEIMNHWVDEIEDYISTNNINPNNFKAIIIPFTGGNAESGFLQSINYNGTVFSLSSLNFQTIAQLRNTIEGLRTLQYNVNLQPAPGNYRKPGSATPTDTIVPINPVVQSQAQGLMRTSIPSQRMQEMRTRIENELINLGPDRNRTEFQVVFLSDGVPKPRAIHIRETIRVVWDTKKIARKECFPCSDSLLCPRGYLCPPLTIADSVDYSETGLNCMNVCSDPVNEFINVGAMPSGLNPTCQRCFDALYDYTFQPCDQTSPANCRDPYSYVGQNLLGDIRAQWGEYLFNNTENIMNDVKDLERLLRRYSEVKYRLNFIRLDHPNPPDRTQPIELLPSSNWLVKAREIFPTDNHIVLICPANEPVCPAPFTLFPGTGSQENYRLNVAYVVNLQGRVNSNGILDSDSDGDGIFDYEEASIPMNFNTANSRSNGICLDGIVLRRNGCLQDSCDATVDKDGDTLNECDENTLGTSDLNFDSDGDGIPDMLEVIYNFNPMVSDYANDDNLDGISNLSNFLRGLSPALYPSRVDSRYWTDFTYRQSGSFSEENSSGQTVQMPGYLLQLNNIQLVEVSESIASSFFYSEAGQQAQNQRALQHVGFGHAQNINRIHFYGRVENTKNPGDAYWVYHQNDMSYGTVDRYRIIPENILFLDVRDPQEVRP